MYRFLTDKTTESSKFNLLNSLTNYVCKTHNLPKVTKEVYWVNNRTE